ncbi:Dolichyl-phosphate-mannose-protein mannosyltransferase [Faunimonas pinastri]|uniref:Dolichyl-phosphate-mannose-protein mannosyltransferase n=1 Tax=Faunimonas pinastri TaxID=1855383 RepID=A0A1H9CPT4_9HYPH|nr:glycosyltransferase family 39 protein [Faunimonas pinastri]SEQ03091.1 Dolichyl-phosphate-mannose-protein mannosyltransferase [Faunimonas pinastri]
MSNEGSCAPAGPRGARWLLPDWLATTWGIALVVVLYGAVHAGLRVWASPALGTDDMLENLWVQTLQLGYHLRQPPLYEWLLWTVQQGFGPTVQSALIVKYSLLTLTAVFLFNAARFAIRDPRIAALAVLSYSLFYQIGWNMLEGVTQTNLLMTCCAATAWTFARCLRNGRWLDYACLGLALGAGILAKFSFPLFPLAMFAAAASMPELRRRIRPSGLIVALVIAVVVVSPFALWIILGDRPLVANAATVMTDNGRLGHMARAFRGLSRLAASLSGFSVALVPLLLVLFWRSFLSPARAAGAIESVPADERQAEAFARLFGRTVLIAILLAVVGIVAVGSTYVKERHMHPLLLLLPIWMFARIERAGVETQRLNWIKWSIAAVAGLLLAIRLVTFLAPEHAVCGKLCRPMRPYAALRPGLISLGFSGGTLIGVDDYTAGNLRSQFPEARALSLRDDWRPPRPKNRDCWLVWEAGEHGPQPIEKAKQKTNPPPAGLGEDHFIEGNWFHLWKRPGYRVTTWGVRQLDPENPVCR